MSDWIEVLRTACEAHTQAEIASRIGYSPTVVNQVLKGTYPGDLPRVEQAVRGALMGESVECPVIGDLPRQRCIEHQRRAGNFAATNPARVQLAKACKTCDHAVIRMEDA